LKADAHNRREAERKARTVIPYEPTTPKPYYPSAPTQTQAKPTPQTQNQAPSPQAIEVPLHPSQRIK